MGHKKNHIVVFRDVFAIEAQGEMNAWDKVDRRKSAKKMKPHLVIRHQ
jgi:hypothetical protein